MRSVYACLHKKDIIKIPYLSLNVATDVSAKFSGALHFSGESMPWRIMQAYQLTRFDLLEQGAHLRTTVGLGAEPFGEVEEMKPRRLICDRSFFVFLWREQADYPYFVVWVDGDELLKKFKVE